MTGLWTMDMADTIYARVVADFPESLKKKYKFQKITVNGDTRWQNFSKSSVALDTKPVFPYITFVELPGQERGQTLEGDSINAAYFTFQADVYHNAKEDVTKECMAAIVKIMKAMRFDAKAMPSFDSKPQEYRSTARFSRVISEHDPI